MLCRFFGGCFASAPLGIVGGTLADFFGPVDRGVAICVFAGATFIGMQIPRAVYFLIWTNSGAVRPFGSSETQNTPETP